METFRHIRSWSFELLSSLPEAAWERKGIHAERGEMSLLDMLGIYARHAEKHADNRDRLPVERDECVLHPDPGAVSGAVFCTRGEITRGPGGDA